MASSKRRSAALPTSNKKKSKQSSPLLSLAELNSYCDLLLDPNCKNYNHLTPLLEQYPLIKKELRDNGVRGLTEVEKNGRQLTVTLFKVFQGLVRNGALKYTKSGDEKKQMVVKWFNAKYDTFKNILLEFLKERLSYESSLQLDMLEIMFELIKLEASYMKSNEKDAYFPTATYKKMVENILQSENEFIVLAFIETFVKYWDLQFYFVNDLNEPLTVWKATEQLSDSQLSLIFDNFYLIMKNQLLFTDDYDVLRSEDVLVRSKLPNVLYKLTHFKTQYQRAFVTVLSYPLSVHQYKEILVILHKRIIPNMEQPQSLMDFLTDAYNVSDDSSVPLLALNSLYELMKSYNLEYPDFYTKLYTLLTPDILYSRYRSRFFRLCDLFLSSTHLSAALVVSFIKRLARLAISASASGVVIVIPFIYNQLKRHPSCMIMLHNPEGAKQSIQTDPFSETELNPLETNALNSSLWELEALMNHYHPNVATLAKIFAQPFRKPSYNLEDFLDWSYTSLLESEDTRRYKGLAALEFEEYQAPFESKETPNAYVSGWEL